MADPPCRRRLSFSLRALMALVLVLSVAFAAMKRPLDRARRQRQAVQAIRKWAIVQYDYQYDRHPPEGSPWLRKLLGGDYFDDVADLVVTDEAADDFSLLADFPGLRRLFAEGNQVKDLTPLTGLVHLEEVHLTDSPVKDLAPLRNLTALKALYLDNTRVEDVAPLFYLDSLQVLSLNGTEVSDVAPLADLTSLRVLSLNSTDVRDLAPLARLQGLIQLELLDTPATAEDAAQLQKQLPRCRVAFRPRRETVPNGSPEDAAAAE